MGISLKADGKVGWQTRRPRVGTWQRQVGEEGGDARRNLGGFVPNKIFVGGVPVTCTEDSAPPPREVLMCCLLPRPKPTQLDTAHHCLPLLCIVIATKLATGGLDLRSAKVHKFRAVFPNPRTIAHMNFNM